MAFKEDSWKTSYFLTMKPMTLDEVKRDLASNLKVARKARGLAQEKLALEADVDRTVVSKIERSVTNPTLDVLLRLANVLELEISDLIRKNN